MPDYSLQEVNKPREKLTHRGKRQHHVYPFETKETNVNVIEDVGLMVTILQHQMPTNILLILYINTRIEVTKKEASQRQPSHENPWQ